MRLLIIAAALIIPVTACGAAAGDAAADVPATPVQPSIAKDPSAAAERVQKALQETPATADTKVSVSTHADTVILTGDTASEEESARVTSMAEKAAGDVRVSSHLEVRPGAQPAATEQSVALVREVEKALKEDQRTANLGVAVSIDDRQVIGLHGLVASQEDRRAAEDVAGRVQGVKRIRSHLVVPGE